MFFRENPFYLLGVHSRDTAETIRTASLEKQGAAKSRGRKAYVPAGGRASAS
ncbi:MAG: hypothetical protein ACLVHE_01805 [Dialister invisus]